MTVGLITLVSNGLQRIVVVNGYKAVFQDIIWDWSTAGRVSLSVRAGFQADLVFDVLVRVHEVDVAVVGP